MGGELHLSAPESMQAEGRLVLGRGAVLGGTAAGGALPSCMGQKVPMVESRERVVLRAESMAQESIGQDREGMAAGDTLAGEGDLLEAPLYTSRQYLWLQTHEVIAKSHRETTIWQGNLAMRAQGCLYMDRFLNW